MKRYIIFLFFLKDATKKTVDEMVCEKEHLKDLNEWKFHYVISQFKELVRNIFDFLLNCF
jgi:hypothetical protein